MYLYRVGQLYSPTRKKWEEHVEYNFRAGAHELRLFFFQPTPEEIKAVLSDPCKFALYVYQDIIFFCFRFGHLPWSDSGSSIHLVPQDERISPPDPDKVEERFLLHVFLVDADTGILKAIRVVSFSPQFTRALHAALWRQLSNPFPEMSEYERQAKRIYNNYTSKEIAEKLSFVRCEGGEA